MQQFTVIDHWQDVPTFARNSGVVNRTIVERIERGVLCYTVIDGQRIIDASATPPAFRLFASTPKAPAFQWPTNLPPRGELVWVSRFAERHSVRTDTLFRAILFGELQAWGAAGRVLVRRADAERIIVG